jgi:hypothetical protein
MTWLNFVPDRIHFWDSEVMSPSPEDDRRRLRVTIELDIDADERSPFAGFMQVFGEQWQVWQALHTHTDMPIQEGGDER